MARTHGKTTEMVLQEIKDIHGDKFLYDKFDYKNCHTKITLGCKIHGYFEKYPNDVKRKNGGCPKCNGSWRKTHDEFLKELPDHLTTNDIYKNAKTKMNFTCTLHNETFTTNPNSILLGHINCPECIVDKSIETKLQNSNSVIDPREKSDYENYRRAVWRYSNRTYKTHLVEQKRDRHNHLDHVLSIVDGFKNNIDPEIMGSMHNLRIISGVANRKKSYKSDITPEELIKRYNT